MRTVYGVYWSPTRTTAKIVETVAKQIAKQGQFCYQQIDFTLPQARQTSLVFQKQDIVVLGTPVYAGRVPNILLKYLNTIQGQGAKAIPIVLFGNRNYDDALIELRDILQNDGFSCIAGGAFVGEHAFSKILGAGRPDEQDIVQAKQFADGIWNGLQEAKFGDCVQVKGHFPVRPYYTPRDRQGNPINILKVKPYTSKTRCNQCGICAQVCPMGSISKESPDVITGICIKCCACVKQCPQNAKYYIDEGYQYHKEELEREYTRRAQNEWFLSW